MFKILMFSYILAVATVVAGLLLPLFNCINPSHHWLLLRILSSHCNVLVKKVDVI